MITQSLAFAVISEAERLAPVGSQSVYSKRANSNDDADGEYEMSVVKTQCGAEKNSFVAS